MSDAKTISRIVIFLGFLFLLVGLLYPGQDGAWKGFQTTMQNTKFPSFDNPFAAQVNRVDLTALDKFCYANAPSANCNANTSSPVGCTFAQAASCLSSNDGDRSYIVISGDSGNAGFNVNVTHDTFADYSIQSVNVAIFCKSGNQASDFTFTFRETGVAASSGPVSCPATNGPYTKVSYAFAHQIINSPFGGNTSFLLVRNSTQVGGSMRITSIQVEIYFIPEQIVCAGNVFENMGCQLANFARVVLKIGLAIVNGIVFALSVFAWMILVMGGLFVAILAMFAFLFTLPGAPVILQGFISAIVIGMLVFVITSVVVIIRGSSTG